MVPLNGHDDRLAVALLPRDYRADEPWAPPGEEPLAPDPGDGPPEDFDWLSLLPPGYDTGPEPEPPAPSPAALRFGFLPDSPYGAGFSPGGAADRVDPGFVLAGLAERAWQDGLDRVSDNALVGLMCSWRRLASWATAGEAAAVAELNRRRLAQVEAGADPGVAEHVCDEIAVPLTLTMRSADLLLSFACQLGRLPLTRAALAAGKLDRAKAVVITGELGCLDDAHAAAAESAIIARAPSQTTAQLRRAARRAALSADPAAARTRRERALKEARVEVWDEHAGTAALAGRDLPPADVLAADRYLSDLARRLQAAGEPGGLDQLRARVYTSLLAGCSPGTILGQPAGPGPDGSGHRSGAPGGSAQDDRQPAAVPASSQPPPAFAPASQPQPVSDPAGQLTGPGGQPATGAATWPVTGATGASPLSGAAPWPVTGSINLTLPLATWLDGSSGAGEVAGFGLLTAADAQALARQLALRRARWCVTLTGPAGQAVAHGCARLADSTGEASRGGEGGWELSVTIKPLAGGECGHQHESAGYRPSPRLRHLIHTRQPYCGYPGCGRPATRCDLDHTVPFDRGGRTCECNLAPLCRRHHRAKQTQGWHLGQISPGVLAWQLPHGRTYQVRPPPLPGAGPDGFRRDHQNLGAVRSDPDCSGADPGP